MATHNNPDSGIFFVSMPRVTSILTLLILVLLSMLADDGHAIMPSDAGILRPASRVIFQSSVKKTSDRMSLTGGTSHGTDVVMEKIEDQLETEYGCNHGMDPQRKGCANQKPESRVKSPGDQMKILRSKLKAILTPNADQKRVPHENAIKVKDE